MKLYLSDGTEWGGISFGADTPAVGEVVFTTGMTGYLETLTDPSYYGQIVCFTSPLIGNYGVFRPEAFAAEIDARYESSRIWVKGVLLCEESKIASHYLSNSTFTEWLKSQGIPALSGVDTRALTQHLREQGTIRGAISNTPMDYADPLNERYVPKVSPSKISVIEPTNPTGKTVAFVDCGAKGGIFRNFLNRGVRVIRLPFDINPYDTEHDFDGVFFSNGPGDPETVTETINSMKACIEEDKPVFGICLGCQIMALGAGGKTQKMKYGHRGANQPVAVLDGSAPCMVTTQNHGFEVDANTLPDDFEVWMENLNDRTVEGIKHTTKPFSSVQFHPEACAGPEDAQWLFDRFIDQL